MFDSLVAALLTTVFSSSREIVVSVYKEEMDVVDSEEGAGEEGVAGGTPQPSTKESKVPEFEPPAACVARIIKQVLPENVQVTKDARAAFTRAAGIFIFYLTHCANEFSRENKRSTIYTVDILSALKELDFGEFEQPVKEFLEQYRAEMASKKVVATKKKGIDGASSGNTGEENVDDDDEAEIEEEIN